MEEWKKIGYCGVDSGQIILVDPCYVMANRGKDGQPVADKNQLTYDAMIEKEGEQPQELVFSGIGGNGVLVRGFGGDGNYPVYARIDDDLVKEIKIVFNQ